MQSERRFINQIVSGETVDQVFLVREKDLRTTRTGDRFLTCVLCDRTGQLPGRMWNVTESMFTAIPVDGFLQVKGRADEYRGALQIIVDACRPVPAEKVELGDFIPVTELDAEAMWTELLEILRDVKDPSLRLLIKKFAEDRAFVAAFKRSPAAVQMHHAFIGGLLEHTLAVAKAARALLPLYPKLNADLVLTGVFLHDAGKCAELSAGTTMQYTDRGQLVGHIVLAVLWISEKAAAVAQDSGEPFPAKTLDLLHHVILSHHGQHEYGSPKLPMVPEAFFIHHLDNLDAKVWMATRQIDNDPDPNASFTAYHSPLETRLYKGSGQL